MAKSPASSAKQAYRYTGPVTPLEVPGQDTRMLYPGVSYRDLPADSPIVQNLIERNILIAEDLTTPAAPVAAANEGA